MPSQICKVVDTGRDPGNAFVVQRAPLPVQGNGMGIGGDLVGLQAREVLVLAIQYAQVGTEEFVEEQTRKSQSSARTSIGPCGA